MIASPSTIRHAWERWRPAWHVSFIMLSLAALAVASAESGKPLEVTLTLALLTALLLAWYSWGELRIKQSWLNHPLPGLSYFGAGWLLWYIAVHLSGAYFLLLFVLFPHIFITVRLSWAVALAMIFNILVLLALNHLNSDFTSTWMLVVVGTSVSGSVLAFFIDNVIRQSADRQRLIGELEAVNETLAKTRYEAGILHERQRLAGELHDTIIQGLVAVVTHLEAADNAASDDQKQHHILRAETITRDNLAEARRFIWAMQPDALEKQALEDSLKTLIENWSAASSVDGKMILTGTVQPVSPAIAHTLLRVTQESLSNIDKHAGAAHVTVTLSYMPDALVLDMNDDGKGFDPRTLQSIGFGLANMRRRIAELGGSLTIESQPAEGTTIVAEIPLRAAKT